MSVSASRDGKGVVHVSLVNAHATKGVRVSCELEGVEADGVEGRILTADALDAHGIALIRLATPTTDDHRLPTVLKRTSGFVYYVSVAGVTGVREADADAVAPAVARVRAASGLPVAVGFGIRTPERAAAIARLLVCEDLLTRPVNFAGSEELLEAEDTSTMVRSVPACRITADGE